MTRSAGPPIGGFWRPFQIFGKRVVRRAGVGRTISHILA